MKYLPSEIEINGVTYYSGLELASKQLDWYNLGKAVGIEEGKKEATFEKVDQFNKGYEIGKYEGYEAGKKANGYSSDDIKKLHTDMNHIHHLWYDKGYNAGKSEGYVIGKKANGISKKEIPGEYLSHIEEARLEGYKEGYSDAKEGGHAEGYNDGITERPKTSFVDWLNRK